MRLELPEIGVIRQRLTGQERAEKLTWCGADIDEACEVLHAYGLHVLCVSADDMEEPAERARDYL